MPDRLIFICFCLISPIFWAKDSSLEKVNLVSLKVLSYGLPLTGSIRLNASPGEYRKTHLHAGIDLSTGGVAGEAVLAVQSGKVLRLKNTLRGSGRTVYLKHEDGLISVYAHLESLSPKLQALLPEGTGEFDFYDFFVQENTSVAKGEVIAYSGESGSGYPHLHFELRSTMARSSKYSILLPGLEDKLPPKIESLQFYSLESGRMIEESSVDKKGLSFEFQEAVGLAVCAFDSSSSSSGKLHLPNLKLEDAKEVLYKLKIKEVKFSKAPSPSLHFVPGATHLSPTRYCYKLFSDHAFESPYIIEQTHQGYLFSGYHSLKLNLQDYHENSTQLNFRVRVRGKQKPLSALEVFEKTARNRCVYGSNIEACVSKQHRNRPLKVRIKELDEGKSLKLAPVRNQVRNLIQIGPDELYWTKRAKVRFKLEKDDSQKVYPLLYQAHRNSWSSLSFTREKRQLEVSLLSPGILALAEDRKAPWVNPRYRRVAGKRMDRFVHGVVEKGSGVDASSLILECEGNKAQGVFDPDRSWIEIHSSCSQPIRFELCDKVENCSAGFLRSRENEEILEDRN